ncbi:MAG: ATP-grasp domain-containing protein [Actinomycetota bacterium]|nr:ATP-grasp domain-containing protein [Actinomycetota bacterium]
MFDTVLVANRGEIACRIIETLDSLGIRSVAVYSDADDAALHIGQADEAVRLGPTPPSESYLSIQRVLDAARRTGAQAIHPGYGFLSENAAFARACAQAGIIFIGPPPEAMEAMGDKISAKRAAEVAGVPVVPGIHQPGMTDEELAAAADQVGFPMLAKAAAGGGGKGMRIMQSPGELPAALAAARREALVAFGDDDLLLERYVERPRHIEIQVLADTHGSVVHLGERECSLQRRHQKVVEECPSPLLDAAQRERMGVAAVDVTRACGYVGAGTVEFIVPADDPKAFFFLEMNTRLQVEHRVTEQVYGLDLVEWQLRIAAGEPLALTPEQLRPCGHAIEARIYAEDPARGFLPTGGRILALRQADDSGVLVDSGIHLGTYVASAYDPLLAKLVAHGQDRQAALAALDAGLADYLVLGVTTNVAFLRRLLAHSDVRSGRLDTGLIERDIDALLPGEPPEAVLAAAALARVLELEPDAEGPIDPFDVPSGWRVGEHAWTRYQVRAGDGPPIEVRVRGRAVSAAVAVGGASAVPAEAWWSDAGLPPASLSVVVDGHRATYLYAEDGDVAWLGRDGNAWALRESDELAAARHGDETSISGELLSPMPGTVTLVAVNSGDMVTAGQTVLVVEAMKMEHAITAPLDGVVSVLHVHAGEQVTMDQPLAVVEPGDVGGDQ